MTTQPRVQRLTLTVAEAADRLGMPKRTIQEKCQRGEIVAMLDHGRWYINAAALRDYVTSRTGHALLAEEDAASTERDAKLHEAMVMIARGQALLAEVLGERPGQ